MPRHKVTIKDVAREAGVSTATVSYVVNQRTDVTISAETRKKVLQVINLLDYTPNQAAKALAANRKSLLAVYTDSLDSIFLNAESMYVTQAVINYFHRKGYSILLLSAQEIEKCDQADAIICYNTSRESFYQLGDNNLIPLLALDCMIDDPLFFQINSDPGRLLKIATEYFHGEPYTQVMLTTHNKEKIAFYQHAVQNPFALVSSFQDVSGFQGENLFITDHVLYELLKDNNHVCYAPSMTELKLDMVGKCIEAAMARTPIAQHNILV